jgi:zinc and cadmium transporter
MSAVAGLMLGVALFHMLPHSFLQTGSLDMTMGWVMIGLLVMFFLIRAFHFHQHDVGLPESGEAHDHDQGHVHSPACAHTLQAAGHAHSAPLRWLGMACGLSLHTLIDGMALAAGVEGDATQGVGWPLYGLGIFLAILLHKPLDAMSISSLMETQGISARWRHVANAGFAAMCPLGAVLFVAGLGRFSGREQLFIGCALAFAAGVFLCISLGDLLPELQFHEHDRLKLSAALLLGVAAAYVIGLMEPTHIHPAQNDRVQQSENRGVHQVFADAPIPLR